MQTTLKLDEKYSRGRPGNKDKHKYCSYHTPSLMLQTVLSSTLRILWSSRVDIWNWFGFPYFLPCSNLSHLSSNIRCIQHCRDNKNHHKIRTNNDLVKFVTDNHSKKAEYSNKLSGSTWIYTQCNDINTHWLMQWHVNTRKPCYWQCHKYVLVVVPMVYISERFHFKDIYIISSLTGQTLYTCSFRNGWFLSLALIDIQRNI